jgi:hypothetical protein
MPTLQVTLSLDLDGQPLPDLTVIRRLVVDNAFPFARIQPTDPSPQTVQDVAQLMILQAFGIRATDQPITLLIGDTTPGDPPAPIAVNPGGFILLFDVAIGQSGASFQPLKLLQSSGQPSAIVGVAGGTSK